MVSRLSAGAQEVTHSNRVAIRPAPFRLVLRECTWGRREAQEMKESHREERKHREKGSSVTYNDIKQIGLLIKYEHSQHKRQVSTGTVQNKLVFVLTW